MESLNRKVYCYKNAGMIRYIKIVTDKIDTIDPELTKKKHRKNIRQFT